MADAALSVAVRACREMLEKLFETLDENPGRNAESFRGFMFSEDRHYPGCRSETA